MTMNPQSQKLTSLQLELLKIFSYQPTYEQLMDIKNILANYFANKATQEMGKLWEDNSWDDSTIEQWLSEHLRTPYEPQ
ncbi:MAG: hypothetical protein CTY16_11440 [Methylobacter sp.]|nr:MAG: hypothetical protein CTY16_11440 [Methylobacter sp.]